eukprot:4935446-Pyramimonas_sp.AAC.1
MENPHSADFSFPQRFSSHVQRGFGLLRSTTTPQRIHLRVKDIPSLRWSLRQADVDTLMELTRAQPWRSTSKGVAKPLRRVTRTSAHSSLSKAGCNIKFSCRT